MESKLNFDFSTMQTVIQKIGRTDGFKSRWEALMQRENVYIRELRQGALTENMRAAVEITGGEMAYSEAEWIMRILQKNDKKTQKPNGESAGFSLRLETPEEHIAAGWHEAEEMVIGQYKSLKINVGTIRMLHDHLLQFQQMHPKNNSIFRTKLLPASGRYADGTEKLLFDTTPPSRIEKEFHALLQWTEQALNQKTIHPLLVIGLFHHAWLCLYPFQTGNFRTGFLLTQLLLLQNGYSGTACAPWFKHITHDRVGYFKALRNSHTAASDKEPRHLGPWIIYFLETLENAMQQVEDQYKKWKSPGIYLSDRQKKVREYIGKHQPVKAGDLQKALPDILVSNLRKDLQYLVSIRQIEKIGHLKSTIYIAPS